MKFEALSETPKHSRLATACLFFLVLCLPTLGPSQQATATANEPKSIGDSDSRVSVSDLIEREISEKFQLVVEGEDMYRRAMFSAFSRDIRREFRNKLKLRPPDWTIPIHVKLSGNPREVVSGNYLATETHWYASNRFRITIRVKLHDRFEEEAYVIELLRALIRDQILQSHSKNSQRIAGRKFVVPEWITYGFAQSIDHKRSGSPSAFYAGFLKSGQLLGTEKIFAVKNAGNLNPVSLAIFKASSSALVETLLDQPGGHLTFRKVLSDLAVVDNPNMDALLRQHFPNFRELENGVEKWWALQLATLAQQQSFEYLAPDETEIRLDRALQVTFEEKEQKKAEEKRKGFFGKLKFSAPKKTAPPLESFEGTLSQFEQFQGRKDIRAGLLRNYNELQTLLAYGFPLYRSAVAKYINILERIAEGKTKGVAEELKELEELRQRIRDTMIRTKDYLNYYEATAAPEKSEAFENYMKLRRDLDKAPPPRRNDSISKHLDQLEIEFR